MSLTPKKIKKQKEALVWEYNLLEQKRQYHAESIRLYDIRLALLDREFRKLNADYSTGIEKFEDNRMKEFEDSKEAVDKRAQIMEIREFDRRLFSTISEINDDFLTLEENLNSRIKLIIDEWKLFKKNMGV